MSALGIAGTILWQLGGGIRIKLMTGAKHIVLDEQQRRINIHLPRSYNLRVTLAPDDTYTVELFKIASARDFALKGKPLMTLKQTVEGVYADNLRTVCEDVTGLRLSL